MTKIVLVLGAAVAVLGAVGVVIPQVFQGWIGAFRSRSAFSVAAIIRIAIGVILLLAAPACRFTLVVQICGVLIIAAAATMLVLDDARIDALFGWWSRLSESAVRGCAMVAVIIGALLILLAV